ncbi:uncharacterized protein Triagg1_574 [Trichoderma aggressivum f. europaeum]|uniref:CHAT domain-containing protein n=1 Tax=Trichoderma aggressivum f. europaeum TaxID=173218 RepID=A0AAE1M5C5_9HYPO|nr:hypothetical protein Triagg1_574 [Trichoderma aggressivum f. europaeum]
MSTYERCEAVTNDDVDWGQNIKDLPPQRQHEFMASLSRSIAAMQQMHASCKHPDPNIGGGDEIEVDLARVIASTHWQLDNILIRKSQIQTDRAVMLHLLADAYQVRYRRREKSDDLECAIQLCEEAQSTFPQDDEDTKEVIYHLAELHNFRYLETRTSSALTKGIEWAKQGIAVTPPGAPHRSCCARVLGNLLHDLYARTGKPEHLDQSIFWGQEMIKELRRAEDLTAARNIMSIRLQDRYELTGAIADLQQSIMYAQRVLNDTGEEDELFGIRLSNVANKYRSRYERSRNEEDLDSAIRLAMQATETDLTEHDARIICSGLGACFHQKFDLSNNTEHIDQSIQWTELALALTPETDVHYPLYVFNLGNQLRARYEAKNNIEAVRIRDATPQTQNTQLMDFLFQSIESRHHRLNIDDLDAAIKHYKDALNALPEDSVYRARIIYHTGAALVSRYYRLYMLQDLEEATSLYVETANYQLSRPLDRIHGARSGGELYALTKNWAMATSCLTTALNLLPLVSPRSLQRDDQQHMISQFSGLAAQAASYALEAGYPAYEALRLLELGRGMIMSFAIDLRSDISSLKMAHPDLYERFDNLREKISDKSPTLEDPSGANFALAEQWDSVNEKAVERESLRDSYQSFEALIKEIRKLDGYDRFLLPLTEVDMMSLAGNGAIVVVSPTELRCDALIVTSSFIRHLPLPELKYEDITKKMNDANVAFARTSIATRGGDNKTLSKILLWLWDTTVEPICRVLGLESKQEAVKHIWWIGTGPLSKAPFHAAGKHPSKSKNILSLVSSSYIATIKALWYARQVANPDEGKSRLRIELISMPDTPGHPSLPNVEEELRCIHDIADKKVDVEFLDRPAKGRVLQQLHQHCDEGVLRVIHFACHGLSDPRNPLESHVLLLGDMGDSSNKPNEPRAAGLSVREVSSMKVQNAYLAYLGACHTANNSVMNLADEGLHVVSSFQLAGFRHAIGNMWKADDESCRLFSKEFYSRLLEGSGGAGEVPEAFHYALKKVRKSVSPGDFIGWVPFVHFGAY